MIEALSVNVGEKVMLSYSDLSDDEAQVKVVNDDTVEVTLRGFAYHISASDFADFVVTQVKMSREIGC